MGFRYIINATECPSGGKPASRKKAGRRTAGRQFSVFALLAALLFGALSCSVEQDGPELPLEGLQTGRAASVRLLMQPEGVATRSESPDEDLITDLNVFLFNSYGLLEDKMYFSQANLEYTDGGCSCTVEMLRYCKYSVYACANTGFEISCSSLDELLAYRYYLAYPDDYRIGVPMSGVVEEFTYKGESEIALSLRRAMAKISISVDRSALDSDVDLTVTGVKVGNCPKSALMFADNAVSGTDDTYNVGFSRSGDGVDNLNRYVSGGVSGEVSLYMFENMQGSPLGQITDYADKEFADTDPRAERCSYIELTASYESANWYSLPGEGLIYRFYLGESVSDFNVVRNCHYHVTMRPEGTGLEGSGWRVDKSGLAYSGPTSISVSPGEIIRGKIGDVIDVRVTTVPEDAPLDLGLEELEEDRERGIYTYQLDSDGRGVTLTLTGSGSGLLYFEAGEPVNDAALVIVVVDLE